MRFNQETIRCDGCNTILKEPGFYINNGAHQETIIKINNKDLCMSCFGRAANMYFREHNIYVGELEPFIEKIKPLNKRTKLDPFLNLDEFYIKFNEAKLENSNA